MAVEGTRNVINAAADEGARRVVFTSSYGAVHMDPSRSPDAVLDETCWSDYDFCKRTDVRAVPLYSSPFARTLFAYQVVPPDDSIYIYAPCARRTCTAAPR